MTSLAFGLVALMLPGPAQSTAPPQVEPPAGSCLHGPSETAAEKARRDEALAVMRMVDWVLEQRPRTDRETRGWQALRLHPSVAALQQLTNAAGILARKVRWGDPEPLPGWSMSWLEGRAVPQVPRGDSTLFALTDVRDPCKFRYDSVDPEVLPPDRPEVRRLDEY